MNIEFSYNENLELKRVAEIVAEKDFFLKYGYGVLLPRYTNFDNYNNFSKAEMIQKIREEMEFEKVEEIKDEIKTKWEKHEKTLTNFFLTLWSKVPDSFRVVFTRYGTGGDYDVPNIITININNSLHPPFQTFVHEAIHCLIEEPIVERYKLTQEEKESMVDYFFINKPDLQAIFPNEKYQIGPPSEGLLKKVGLKD